MTSVEVETKGTKSACQTLSDLWSESLQFCQVDQPGYEGSGSRGWSHIKCDNIQWAMSLAMMQCWNERSNNSLVPPVFLTKEKYIHTHSHSNSSSSDSSAC